VIKSVIALFILTYYEYSALQFAVTCISLAYNLLTPISIVYLEIFVCLKNYHCEHNPMHVSEAVDKPICFLTRYCKRTDNQVLVSLAYFSSLLCLFGF